MPVERTAAEIENDLLGAAETQAEELNHDTPDNDNDNGGDDTDDSDASSQTPNYDQEAGRKGWVPKALYKGDPKKWVDAKTFIERGERFNKNLQREVAELRQELASFKGTAAKFQKFHEETVARKNEEIKEAISALRIQRAEALRDGDAVLSVELEDKIDHLKEQQSQVKEAAKEEKAEYEGKGASTPERDVVLEEWVEDGNTWFRDVPQMRDYAIRVGTELRDSGVPVNGREFLDRVTETMHRDFPRYFRQSKPQTRQSSVDNGDSGGSGSSSGYSERDLPAEDRALMKEFIAQGVTTKEAFLKSYFSEAPRKHQTQSKK